jgi:dienelactone hydrolase
LGYVEVPARLQLLQNPLAAPGRPARRREGSRVKAAAAVFLLWLAAIAQTASAQPAAAAPAQPGLAADLREEVLRLPVTAKDLYGREETREIAATVFRPPGDGPFPLLVMSHGRAPSDRRAGQGRQRYEPLARYLVSKGFAVFVPTRIGYGDTYGDFDPETSGARCDSPRPAAATQAAADQVLATVNLARGLAWVDATRWVAMGQSMGGTATLAVASRNPPGLVAAVNFAGGLGGNPETRPGDPCGPSVLARLWENQAASAGVPVLWIYGSMTATGAPRGRSAGPRPGPTAAEQRSSISCRRQAPTATPG